MASMLMSAWKSGRPWGRSETKTAPSAAVTSAASATAASGGSGSALSVSTSHAAPPHGGLHVQTHSSTPATRPRKTLRTADVRSGPPPASRLPSEQPNAQWAGPPARHTLSGARQRHVKAAASAAVAVQFCPGHAPAGQAGGAAGAPEAPASRSASKSASRSVSGSRSRK